VLLAGCDEYKRVFGLGEMDHIGLFAKVLRGFGVGQLA
jgi:hypothetical protein